MMSKIQLPYCFFYITKNLVLRVGKISFLEEHNLIKAEIFDKYNDCDVIYTSLKANKIKDLPIEIEDFDPRHIISPAEYQKLFLEEFITHSE